MSIPTLLLGRSVALFETWYGGRMAGSIGAECRCGDVAGAPFLRLWSWLSRADCWPSGSASGGGGHARTVPVLAGLVHIGPTADKVSGVLRLRFRTDHITGVGVGFGSVWVSTQAHGLDQLNPTTGKTLSTTQLTGGGGPFAIGLGHVYVTGGSVGSNNIQIIDPANVKEMPHVFSTQPFMSDDSQGAFYVATGFGSLWVWESGVSDCCNGRVFWRINPHTGHVVARWQNPTVGSQDYEVDRSAVAIGPDGVWRTRNGALQQIDVRTNRLLAPRSAPRRDRRCGQWRCGMGPRSTRYGGRGRPDHTKRQVATPIPASQLPRHCRWTRRRVDRRQAPKQDPSHRHRNSTLQLDHSPLSAGQGISRPARADDRRRGRTMGRLPRQLSRLPRAMKCARRATLFDAGHARGSHLAVPPVAS
jgi:hypothetical protein